MTEAGTVGDDWEGEQNQLLKPIWLELLVVFKGDGRKRKKQTEDNSELNDGSFLH